MHLLSPRVMQLSYLDGAFYVSVLMISDRELTSSRCYGLSVEPFETARRLVARTPPVHTVTRVGLLTSIGQSNFD